MVRRSASHLLVPVSGILVLSLFLPGCKQQQQLTQRLDPTSQERLAAIPAGESVLLSLTGKRPLADLPPLGEGGRVLSRSGNSLLLEVPRSTLPDLGGVKDVTGSTIWGGGSTIAKLDPSLRAQVLQALDDETPGRTLNMIATFSGESADVRARLESLGALPRTVAGSVVTLDASPRAVLALLSMPDLVSLNRPRILTPLQRDQ